MNVRRAAHWARRSGRRSIPKRDLLPDDHRGAPEGVLGVALEPLLADHQRSVLSAAAALIAVSLKNSELFREVRENSVRDALTGCFNRMHALEVLDAELRRARRSRLPLSLVMFDLDNFKGINDRLGHLCGDAAGGRRRNDEGRIAGSDLKCRYGGDEFMVILPDTPLAGAKQVSENLRRAIAEHPVTWNDGQDDHRQLRDYVDQPG